MKPTLSLVLAGICAVSSAQAVVIVPSAGPGGSFGPLPEANFGGSGIPNDSVQQATFQVSPTLSATIGLTVTQRYSNSAPTNDGAGTFGVLTGGDTISPPPNTNAALARWNVGLYVQFFEFGVPIPPTPPGSPGLPAFQPLLALELYFDANPAVGNDVSPLPGPIPGFLPSFQDSTNLGYGFAGPFDPNAPGEYGFSIRLVDLQSQGSPGGVIGETSILVNASAPDQVPDGGTSLMLLGLSLFGLGAVRKKLR